MKSLSPGVVVHAGEHQLQTIGKRLDEAVRLAEISGDHVWITTVVHLVRDPAKAVAGDLTLDLESMAMRPHLGCWRCEEVYEPRLLNRRCPGEPRG